MEYAFVFFTGAAIGWLVAHFTRARRWYSRGVRVGVRRALTIAAREATDEPPDSCASIVAGSWCVERPATAHGVE